MRERRYTNSRSSRGGTIAEFGPALGLLFLGFFFPLLNLMGIGISYADCLWFNHKQSHEASLVSYTDATSATGSIQKGLVDAWKSNGIGQFVQLTGDPLTQVHYRPGQTDASGNVDKIVEVQTHFVVKPFITIPTFGLVVPGISAAIPFDIYSEYPMENPDNAGP